MLIASRRSGQPVCPAPPLAPRPPGTRRCLRNSAPLLGDSSRVIVAPMSRRESLSSSPLPDAGCRFASKQRSRNGNKKGGRSRCRGSKNKKYCKTRRKLRGPTPKLAASGQAPCVGPSASGAIATSIPDAAGSRRASNAGRRPASTSASNVRRATDPRSPCALTPAWRGCAGRQINRAKKTAKKATATAQLLATTEELANLNLNPKAPQGSMPSFLQLTQLALAATNVLLGAHSRG